MSTKQNILDFSKGEGLAINLSLQNRDETPLVDAATQTIDFVISASAETDPPIAEFDTTPQIVLVDAPTAAWTVAIAPADLSALTEGVEYRYDVWSTSVAGLVLHQIGGALLLAPATSPTP